MFYEERCTRCGDCLARCHYFDYDQEEAIKQIECLIAGEFSEVVKNCVTCAACNNYCPEDANPFDLILKRNEETDAMPIRPLLKKMYELTPAAIPSSIVPGDPEKPALSLCELNSPKYLSRGIGGPMFDGMTLISGGDYFCYQGYVHFGQKERIGDYLPKFVANLTAANCRDIVFFHDECYSALHVMCKEFGIDVPFRYQHINQYMLDYLKSHSDQIQKLDMTVAYHAPCSARYIREMDSVIDEIFEMIGVRRPSRRFEYDDALCCGLPLDVRGKEEEEKAARYRAINLDDMQSVGATVMVAGCPMCVRTLCSDAEARGMDVYMIHDLVRLALGETLPDTTHVPIIWEEVEQFISSLIK